MHSKLSTSFVFYCPAGDNLSACAKKKAQHSGTLSAPPTTGGSCVKVKRQKKEAVIMGKHEKVK